MPTFGCTAVWLNSSYTISIGSSIVVTLTSREAITLSAEYSVVVLPEPVGPVTRTMPCGRLMKSLKVRHLLGIEAEAREVLHDHLRVEDPHHQLLAEGDRQGRDAQLDLAAAAHRLHPAVLGPSLLGDVEARHRLHPVDDRLVHQLGHRLDVVQHAVDAEADQADVALGFQVHVAGAGVVGVLEHELDGVDDVLIALLDLGFVLEANQLLEIAEVDRRP